MFTTRYQTTTATFIFDRFQAILGLKHQLVIPYQSIKHITLISRLDLSDYLEWDTPKLGLYLPSQIAQGTFYKASGQEFFMAKQHQNALVLDLDAYPYVKVVVSASRSLETEYTRFLEHLS